MVLRWSYIFVTDCPLIYEQHLNLYQFSAHGKFSPSGCDVTVSNIVRGQLKCDGSRAETRFRLSAKRTSPFKSATGSRGVRISGSNAGYTMFRGSVKSTGYPLHSPVSPSLPFPCVTVCHHISTGVYLTLCFIQHWTLNTYQRVKIFQALLTYELVGGSCQLHTATVRHVCNI